MNKTEFADDFILALHGKVAQRPKLVREVARILRIEHEPASRRLNGSVKFSVNEMGRLAKELDISLDGIINNQKGMFETHSVMELLWCHKSIDALADLIEDNLSIAEKVSGGINDSGMVLDSLSLSLAISYPHLMKLYLFRWGHLFVDSDDFEDYASWGVPERFTGIIERYHRLRDKRLNLICIWDNTLIRSTLNEINYLRSVNALDDTDCDCIKSDLHGMLSDLENNIKNSYGELSDSGGIAFYLSNIQIGASCWYMSSEEGQAALSYSNFARNKISRNEDYCKAVKNWVFSLKRISTLVSGSGYKERRRFFMEQHDLVDSCI